MNTEFLVYRRISYPLLNFFQAKEHHSIWGDAPSNLWRVTSPEKNRRKSNPNPRKAPPFQLQGHTPKEVELDERRGGKRKKGVKAEPILIIYK